MGKRLAAHHQTVQRCVERAVAYGALAALDDRPRPGKEPTITPEAKAWVVSLACDKAKEHGYPHELWTTRLLARHARENAPAAGHECLANLAQGTVSKILGQEEIKPHKVRARNRWATRSSFLGSSRSASMEPRMGPRSRNPAPGHPGIPARWTSSAKSGVGTAPAVASRVWFTLSHGILDEIYYPRVDYACTRDFGLIVTDGRGYFSEEKRDAASIIRPVDDGVPAFMLRNVSRDGRYVIEKLVLADPRRDVVLQHVRFKAQSGALSDYRLYALLAPHLVNRGAHNTAWLADHKGREMLFASGSGNALALGCSATWRARSVGFVGASDGWQDLTRHYVLTWAYDLAEDGNVALTGEMDLAACSGEFVLALGFGRRSQEAAHRVIASLNDGVDLALADYTAGWRTWQEGLLPLDRPGGNANTYRISTAVIRSHEASSFPGGIIASSPIPWGFNKGDEDLGGYHLVWPRDLVETAGALVAAGDFEDARRVLHWLEAQEADGHWPQNCWLDGAPYWTGVQIDECAFPILLVDLIWREGGLRDQEVAAALAHGASRRGICRPQRSGHRPGSLGGGWRLLALHTRCRNRSAPRRSRHRRSGGRAGRTVSARDRR